MITIYNNNNFNILINNFLSIIQIKLPMKIIIFNNNILNFITIKIKTNNYLTNNTKLHNTNFTHITKTYNITNIHIKKTSKINKTLQHTFSINNPILINIIITKKKLTIPPQIKLKQTKNFNLYILHTIINKHNNKIIKLTKTN